MPRIAYFEIYADDVDRAVKFYADLFGWEINKWDGPPQMDYRLASTGAGPGIDGGITRRPPPESGLNLPGVNYVTVANIDEYLPQNPRPTAAKRHTRQNPHPRPGLHRHRPGYRGQPHRPIPKRRNRRLLTAACHIKPAPLECHRGGYTITHIIQ